MIFVKIVFFLLIKKRRKKIFPFHYQPEITFKIENLSICPGLKSNET